MKPTTSAYFKYFGIFLLLAFCGGAIVSLINSYLRHHDLTSPTSLWVLGILLMVYFFFLCRWLFRRLNAIEKQQ